MTILSFLARLMNAIHPSTVEGWRYKGITNKFMHKHAWTNGAETLEIFHMNGAGTHSGFVIEVTGIERDATLVLSNGFIRTFQEAMVIADLYMRDDRGNPAAFMYSDRIESDHGAGNTVRQDEWLKAHAPDYDFSVIDPSQAS